MLSPLHDSDSILETRGNTAASVLPPAVGATSRASRPAETGSIASSCSGLQRRPAEAVHDVVLDGGMEPIERAHGSMAMSSTDNPPAADRSVGVSSASLIVSA